MPIGHPDRARLLANLGSSLIEHGKLTQSATSLAEAVVLCREAVAATPRDHPRLAMRRYQLVMALLLDIEHSGNLAYLVELFRTRK